MRDEHNPLGLSSLEIASNVVTGARQPPRPLPPARKDLTPREALERAVVGPLSRPPCGVSFSGGRDSSAALAVATAVARREGLPLPIPVTLRYPKVPAADESTWQEEVVRHLGLTDWETIDIADELDLLGPVATSVLRRHGLLWPANTHVHEPVLERLEGGSLITGVDGDGLLAGWRWQLQAEFLARRRKGRPLEALRVMHAASPRRVRRAWSNRRTQEYVEWLKPEAARAVTSAQLDEEAAEPFRWGARVRWYESRRYLHLLELSFDRMASDHGTLVLHIFREPQFLAQLATGRLLGPGDRTEVMRTLFGDLLPAALIGRATKALFGDAFWGPHTRSFIERWDGSGVDPDLVDASALRRVWVEQPSRDPGLQSAVLLQSTWLQSERHGF